MKKLLFILFFLHIWRIELFSQEDIWFAKAEQALNENRYDDAVEYYSKIIEKNPKNIDAFFNRGIANMFMKNAKAAIDDFDRTIELDPKSADAYNNRGFVNEEIGYKLKAIADYDMAIKLNPKLVNAYINRGFLYLKDTSYTKAINNLSKAIKLNPKSDEAYFHRGCAYYKLKDYLKSIPDFEKAEQNGMKNSKLYYNWGNSYYKLEKYEKASEIYTKGLERNPEDLDALNNRAMAYELSGQLIKADVDRYRIKKLLDPFADAGPADSVKLKTYYINNGELQIDLPQGWNCVKDTMENVNNIYLSPEKITQKNYDFDIGIRLSFNPDIRKILKAGTGEEIIEEWKKLSEEDTKDFYFSEVKSQKIFNKLDYNGMLITKNARPTTDDFMYYYFDLALAKSPNLFFARFQSPFRSWSYLSGVYDRCIASLKVNDK